MDRFRARRGPAWWLRTFGPSGDDLTCAISLLGWPLNALAVAAVLKMSGGTRLRRWVSPSIRGIFAPLRAISISSAYRVLIGKFRIGDTCVETGSWRHVAPEWGSGSREFKSRRPDQPTNQSPSPPMAAYLERAAANASGTAPTAGGTATVVATEGRQALEPFHFLAGAAHPTTGDVRRWVAMVP